MSRSDLRNASTRALFRLAAYVGIDVTHIHGPAAKELLVGRLLRRLQR